MYFILYIFKCSDILCYNKIKIKLNVVIYYTLYFVLPKYNFYSSLFSKLSQNFYFIFARNIKLSFFSDKNFQRVLFLQKANLFRCNLILCVFGFLSLNIHLKLPLNVVPSVFFLVSSLHFPQLPYFLLQPRHCDGWTGLSWNLAGERTKDRPGYSRCSGSISLTSRVEDEWSAEYQTFEKSLHEEIIFFFIDVSAQWEYTKHHRHE